MVERVLCKHEVVGSIPSGSTIFEASDMPSGDGGAIAENNRVSSSGRKAGGWFDDIVN